MSRIPAQRHSMRARLFLAHLLVIAVGVAVLFLVTLAVGQGFHDRLMAAMLGPEALGIDHDGPMAGMADALTRVFNAAMIQALLLSASAATLAAVVVSLFLSQRIVTPIRRLLAASRRIAAGQYAERVDSTGDDELGALAAQFNTMASELEAAERRRVALIGDVAHELRTPLATIEGYAEGLLDGVVEQSPATWALLHDEVGRLRRLVQDLQELARAEAHQIPLRIGRTDPAMLAEQSAARMAPQYEEKGIALVCDIQPGLPRIDADRDRIMQVLINLMGNALCYTASGGIVRVTARGTAGEVLFCVSDNGIGVAPEHLPHLFERFYRVDKARARALGGNGIGLTIARALVEAHGGRIWAESDGLGCGAAFRFTLPAAENRNGVIHSA